MTLDSHNTNEVDLGLGVAPVPMGLQWATVGWDDKVEIVDLGSSTNDGCTFVFVTTYAGRTPGDPPKPGVAQGHKYIAQVLGPGFVIPAKGQRVLVGFPSGMETTPGAAVILGTVGPGAEVKRNVAAGDLTLTAPGGGSASVIIKANGAVTMMTTSDNTPSGKLLAVTLSPAGLSFDSPYGGTKHDATGYHLKTKAGPRIDLGGISIPGLPGALTAPLSAYCNITAPIVKVAGASVFLGAGSTFAPMEYAALTAIVPPLPAQGAMLTALNTFAAAVGTAVASIAAGSSGALAGAAITTAAGVLATAVAAAPLSVQSQTVYSAP